MKMKTDKKNIYIYNTSGKYLKLINNFYNQYKNREYLNTCRNTTSNSNSNKITKEIPYSIKPFLCSVPKDISLHEIFINMMNSSFKINGNKAIYIKMSQEELEIRNYILNRIKLFIEKNDIEKKILCSIIFLYDILTIKNKEEKLLNSFEEIGLGASFLTLKFLCSKKKSFYSIKKYMTIFQNEDLSAVNIKEIEIKCLKLMCYYLSYASPISFMEIFFINGIIFSNDNLKDGESGKIYDLVIEIIEKIMLISNEYIKHNPVCLCSCIVSYAREIYNLEIWPQILTQAFGVNFYSFQNIYNEFHDLIFPINKIEKPKDIELTHKKRNSKIYEDIDVDNQNEMKLHPSSSIVQNIIDTYRYRSPIKIESDKSKKYINVYYKNNNNYIFNRPTNNNKNDEVFIKKNRLFHKTNLYNNDKEKTEEYLKEKKIKEMEIEIPSLNNKKNNSLGNIYDNNILDNNCKAIKINKKIVYKTKEDDYSNVATSENSNNYNKNNLKKNHKKNYIICYDYKKNNNIENNYNEPKENKDNENNENNDYIDENNTISKTSQKKYIKNYPRWSSIKKYCKLKQNLSKENLFPSSESKPIYYKKIYK